MAGPVGIYDVMEVYGNWMCTWDEWVLIHQELSRLRAENEALKRRLEAVANYLDMALQRAKEALP